MQKPSFENAKPAIGFLLLLAIICYGLYKTEIAKEKRDKSIREHRYETIARVRKYERHKYNNDYKFEYFYNGNKYESQSNIDHAGKESCVGRYYKIELSTENPDYVHIFLDQEVFDTAAIKKTGLMKSYVEELFW